MHGLLFFFQERKVLKMTGLDIFKALTEAVERKDLHMGDTVLYCDCTTNTIEFRHVMPGINRIIFNNPATIVYWTDGTKTVVKAHDEEFSEEHGLAMAFAKKVLETSYGNKNPRASFKRLVREATRY